jgi:hypothetical protein
VRFIHFYLVGYFMLAVGAVLALWQAGAIARISGVWLTISAVIVIAPGIILAVSSRGPTSIAHE